MLARSAQGLYWMSRYLERAKPPLPFVKASVGGPG